MTTNNGERMLQWCLQHKMKIINTMFRSKRIHRETWRNPITGKWKRLDYICTTKWVSKFIKSCRVFTRASNAFDTDHRIVVMNLQFPATKKQLKIQLSRTEVREPKPKINFLALKDNESLQENLTEKLNAELNDFENMCIDDLNECIVTTVQSCVKEVCPNLNPRKKNEPWEDKELNELISRLNKCSDHMEMRRLQKEIKEKRKILKK